MRFISGIYLLIMGFVWTSTLSPGGWALKLFPSMLWAEVFGYALFLLGLVCMSPRFFAWADEQAYPAMALPNQLMRGSWGVAGGLIALLGVAGMVGGVFAIKPVGALVAFLSVLTGLVMTLGGVSMLLSLVKHLEQRREVVRAGDPTPLVLRIARAQRGRVSAAEVAASSRFDLNESRGVLAKLAREGHCEERVNSMGASFYLFPEFAGDDAKRDILDDDAVTFGLGDEDERDASSAQREQREQGAAKRR